MTAGKNHPVAKATAERLRLGMATSWDILCDALANYRVNGNTNQAAAIALYAILSIIPLFILTLLLVNNFFRSKTGRNYIVSKLLAIGMIPLGWAVGIASVVLTYIAAVLAKQPVFVQGWIFITEVQGVLFRYLLPYLLTVIFFTVLYKVIPAGRVGLRSALIGSAIFSALMEIAKQSFTWYVANYTRYDVIFGSLEAGVILVIWE